MQESVLDPMTPAGPARVRLTVPDGPVAGTVVATHGAGGSTGSPDLMALVGAALARGFAVAAVEQPYRVAAARRPPPRPTVQDPAWLAVVAALDPRPPLVLAGRSNGARLACRTATALDAAGVVALAFPVHPPGRPDRSRLAELALPDCPVLVVQGQRDPFGVPGRGRGRRTVVVAGADHGLAGAETDIDREVRAFLRRLARPATAG